MLIVAVTADTVFERSGAYHGFSGNDYHCCFFVPVACLCLMKRLAVELLLLSLVRLHLYSAERV